mmetsp:Transcript_2056/g.5975  ORF Transcript_2056/g.5975 Transcript_2056/m.5975 type:complete len:247 (+) Transcript_2056:581-1321(+)
MVSRVTRPPPRRPAFPRRRCASAPRTPPRLTRSTAPPRPPRDATRPKRRASSPLSAPRPATCRSGTSPPRRPRGPPRTHAPERRAHATWTESCRRPRPSPAAPGRPTPSPSPRGALAAPRGASCPGAPAASSAGHGRSCRSGRWRTGPRRSRGTAASRGADARCCPGSRPPARTRRPPTRPRPPSRSLWRRPRRPGSACRWKRRWSRRLLPSVFCRPAHDRCLRRSGSGRRAPATAAPGRSARPAA